MIRRIKNYFHLVTAIIANWYYRSPSKEVTVIGVTGTDGKTTTTSLIHHILEHAGKKSSMISTVFAKVGGKEFDTGFHVSTPHSFTVQRFLRQSVAGGDEYFVMETTSHALDQHRVAGVEYKVGVVTNITHEHLDYHKTFENYVQAKCKLLHQSHIRIVNREDGSYKLISQQVDGLTSYGIMQGDYTGDIAERLKLSLPTFNKYNYLAAFATCRELGIDEDVILDALVQYEMPPGRMEEVFSNKVTAVVDFAHTPHSLEQALSAVRKKYLKKSGSRLIHIFGCASERDVLKRPLMGEVSASYADLIIITEEDYRNEDPQRIADEIAMGIVQREVTFVELERFGLQTMKYTIIHNRAEAVKKAVGVAKPGDVILLTGKGHEQSLCRGGTEYPWNDAEAVTNALRARFHE